VIVLPSFLSGKTESEIDNIRASTAKSYADSALVNLQAKENGDFK